MHMDHGGMNRKSYSCLSARFVILRYDIRAKDQFEPLSSTSDKSISLLRTVKDSLIKVRVLRAGDISSMDGMINGFYSYAVFTTLIVLTIIQ